ncbi:hypothetical protein [Fredinandcohnia onubensis]|nr:hypothetical protein [Fredinandcohnia onubensis]
MRRSFISKKSRKELVIETQSIITEDFESESSPDSDRESINSVNQVAKNR